MNTFKYAKTKKIAGGHLYRCWNVKNMRRENFFLHVWQGRDYPLFEVIQTFQFDTMKRENPEYSKWLFYGKWANVFVIASDEGITRQIALEMANRYMKGDYTAIHVDLDKCTSRFEKGIEKTPRH